jgi:hypothetical protein
VVVTVSADRKLPCSCLGLDLVNVRGEKLDALGVDTGEVGLGTMLFA